MVEFTDNNVPIECGECNAKLEGVPTMEQHIRETHPNYSPIEVVEHARAWADSAYDDIDAHNLWRTQEYRRTGHDPEDIDEDPL